MTLIPPLPGFLNESAGADRGLICGYGWRDQERPHPLAADDIRDSLDRDDTVTWLHFNLSDARARRWLIEAAFLPDAMRGVLQEHDENRRIELVDDGVLLVMGDLVFDDASDPSEVETLWCFASARHLITARIHPLRSADELRLRVRDGIRTSSGLDLLGAILNLRTERLKRHAAQMVDRLDTVEDDILAGSIEQQREHLGRVRRLCARFRRQFSPERIDMNRFLHRPPGDISDEARDTLQECTDALGFVLEEFAELYERAKLLQEELAARLAENTSRNLYILSILTAVLLPMTLVTGIFGMNVAHLPGSGSFWTVMCMIIASGAATLAAFFWRRLL